MMGAPKPVETVPMQILSSQSTQTEIKANQSDQTINLLRKQIVQLKMAMLIQAKNLKT